MRKQIHASYALLTRASNFPSPSGLCIDRGNDGKKERELDYVGRARDAEWQVGRRLVRRSWSIAVAIQSVLWLFKKLASFGSRVGSFNFGCPCRSSARARREYVYISPFLLTLSLFRSHLRSLPIAPLSLGKRYVFPSIFSSTGNAIFSTKLRPNRRCSQRCSRRGRGSRFRKR